jgi:hypothetical protein
MHAMAMHAHDGDGGFVKQSKSPNYSANQHSRSTGLAARQI